MGYSAWEDMPPGARPPRDTGVPLMGVPSHRIIQPLEFRVPKAPKPPRALQPKPSHEECIWRHCVQEAKREIDCLSIGTVYHWQPYEPRWQDQVELPLLTDEWR